MKTSSLLWGILGGCGAALVGGFIWGSLVGITGLQYELDWVPMVGTGFLVGSMVRLCGQGHDWRFRVSGATIALLACLLGQLLTLSIAVAWQLGNVDNFYLFTLRPDSLLRLYLASVGLIDILCWAFTAIEGYVLSASRRSKEIAFEHVIDQSHNKDKKSRISIRALVILVLVFPSIVLLTWLSVSRWSVQTIQVSPDGQTLAVLERTIDGSGRVRFWKTQNGKALASLIGEDKISSVAFASTNGSVAFVCTMKERRKNKPGLKSFSVVKSWKLNSNNTPILLLKHASRIKTIFYMQDDNSLCVLDVNGQIQLWDLKSSEPQTSWSLDCVPQCIAVSPDGDLLAVGTMDGVLQLWDLQTEKLRFTVNSAHRYLIQGLAFSTDGKSIASVGGLDCRLSLWDTKSGKQTKTIPIAFDWLSCVAFSPNGTLAVGGGSFQESGQVHLLDPTSLKVKTTFEVPTNTARCVAFALDGKMLLVGSGQPMSITSWYRQGEIQRWELPGGNHLSPLQ